jgi:glycosyltransferase involved in cell wall biosynthesis
MPTSPLVSIVLPVYNDEQWIAAALDSCVNQTLEQIEIVCVDDASVDRTADIIEDYSRRDARVRLIRQDTNRSAFQARRAGIEAAAAPYIMFLDGDDELTPGAAEKAYAAARNANVDLLGFGVRVLGPRGGTVRGYQGRLAHRHRSLRGDAVLRALFPVGKAAHGQLWRYLFKATILQAAYAALPEDLVLPRVNDLPITFLAVANATSFDSIPDQLYNYHFRRGGSGHFVEDLARFEFYLGGIDSVDSISSAVHALAYTRPDAEQLVASYESVRLAIIGNVLGYLIGSVEGALYASCLAALKSRVPSEDVVMAAAGFCPEAIELLARYDERIEIGDRPVHSVLLTTKSITTGGVSGVLLSQARYLLAAGYRVTIAVHRAGSALTDLPPGAKIVQVTGSGMQARLASWAQICRDESIDVVVDHRVLYTTDWTSFAVMARALNVPTVGWIHNFALRPIYDNKDLVSFIQARANALARLVTLSPLDVAFWKLRGVPQTVYLPNPPSPMLLKMAASTVERNAPTGRAELIWWGRLDENTKQVRQLVEVAAQLRRLAVDFHLSIIGPDWGDMTATTLTAEVVTRNLGEHVSVLGPRHGQELIDAIDAADAFVTTSIIEGYQLTLPEAQIRGLPVFMYELPWLTVVQNNSGIVSVPQGEAHRLARSIAETLADPEQYARLSAAAIEASQRALGYDFSQLYTLLVSGTLPAEFSPTPTFDDASQLLQWMIFYAERSALGGAIEPQGRATGLVATRVPKSVRARVLKAGAPLGNSLLEVFPSLLPFARRVVKSLSA